MLRFPFINNPARGKVKGDIRLISLHIPKTAGTSFRNVLKNVYGDDSVQRVDQKEFPAVLPREVNVIHGHFRYPRLIEFYNLKGDIPLITWLRDPVERVISNFYYLQKVLKENLAEEEKGLNILSKMQKTLLEYANAKVTQNIMSGFLTGLELKEMLFVGIYEEFDKDLSDLACLLGWPTFETFRHNSTGSEKQEVCAEIREEIKRLNLEDVELYNEALALREERLRRSRGNG